MGFLFTLGILLFGSVASTVLRGFIASRQRRPPPGAYDAPIVASGTAIPVLYGTRAIEGITTWFHGAKLVEVNIDTHTLFGFRVGKANTVAYHFKVTMQQVLCWGPVVDVRNILFGDKSFADQQTVQQYDLGLGDGSVVTQTALIGLIGGESGNPLYVGDVTFHGGLAHFGIFLPSLFGGTGRGGGVTAINGDSNNPWGGSIRFKGGTLQYGPDDVMVAKLGAGNVPSYGDLCSVVYDDVNMGDSPSATRWRWVVFRKPVEGMAIPGAISPEVNQRAIAGLVWSWLQTDLNAAAIIYDLLRNPLYGLGEPESGIAQGIAPDTFQSAQNTLQSEGLGVSMLFSGERTKAQDAMDELLRTVDGMLVRDPVTYQRKLKLLRNEAPTTMAFNALRLVDEQMIIAFEPFARAEWIETINVVTVGFSDATLNYERNTVTLRNEANIAMTGGERAITIEYPSVTDRVVARKLGARDLRALSMRLRKGPIKVTRAGWDIERGDVVRLSYAQYGIDQLLVRVMAVDLGDGEDGAISLDVVEDVFQYEDIARAAGTPSDPPRFPSMTRPQITATTQTRTGVTDSLSFTLVDSEHRATEVAVRKTVGGAAPGSWEVLATGTSADDLSGVYTATVAATGAGDSVIEVRVTYDLFDPPVSLTLNEAYTFPSLSGAPTAQTLVEADPIVWDTTAKLDDTASVTLTANRTLSIVGAVAAWKGTLLVTTIASRTLTLPSNSLVRGGTSNVVTIAAGHTRLTATYDGARFWWNNEGTFVADTSLAASGASSSSASASLTTHPRLAASVTSASTATGTLHGLSAALAAAVSSGSSVTGTLGTASAYGQRNAITIDPAKVGASDHTNAVLLFAGTYPDLATLANGGFVHSALGRDIGFFADATLLTKLKWELEYYDPTTGAIVAWVKVPSVSHTVPTVSYLGYGSGSVTTDQSDPPNVWDTSDSLVMHMGDGVTLSTVDSTANGNSGTAINAPTAAAGQIGGAVALAAVSQQYVSVPSATSLQMTNTFTLSAWVYPTSFADYRMIICKGNVSGGLRDYDIDLEQTSGKIRFYFTQGSGNYQGFTGSTGLTLNAWAFVVATYDGTTMRVYLNGAPDGTRAQTGNADATTDIVAIGRTGALASSNYFDGRIDEPRIAKGIARSPDWVTFRYNNESSPSTFYALGSRVTM